LTGLTKHGEKAQPLTILTKNMRIVPSIPEAHLSEFAPWAGGHLTLIIQLKNEWEVCCRYVYSRRQSLDQSAYLKVANSTDVTA